MTDIDKYDLYNKLILNEGAYFYEVVTTLQKADITNLFKYIQDSKPDAGILARIVRKEEVGLEYNTKALCSLLIYGRKVEPSFIDFTALVKNDALLERKISYLLVVEIDNYVVFVKKNVNVTAALLDKLSPVDGKRLSGACGFSGTTVQSVSMTNMNQGNNALRNKTLEANDLEGSMPMFGLNKQYVKQLKFGANGESCTINTTTSRLSKFGSKKCMSVLVGWMDEVVENLKNNKPGLKFLDHFAEKVSWKNERAKLTPTSILFNLFDLHSYMEELEDHSIYYKRGEDVYDDETSKLWRLFNGFNQCYELVNRNNRWVALARGRTVSSVEKMKSTIKVHLHGLLGNCYIKTANGFEPLWVTVNRRNLYSIGFDDLSYIYAGNALYRNNSITRDLPVIESVLSAVVDAGVTSEKGTGYQAGDVDFKSDSLFYDIEHRQFSNAQFLVCDDMGNEWADFIAIQDDKISFIHGKCKKQGLSASNFQDIIGQAEKNLGNYSSLEADIDAKAGTWATDWKLDKTGNVAISRCRKGSIAGFVDRYKELCKNPNHRTEICLSINFISYSQLQGAFRMLENNTPFKQMQSAIQMVWLLNSFISICKDAGYECRILCVA